ncbi:hypothetical protein VTK26DRAFT_1505 [Humicola hyalothermophila]
MPVGITRITNYPGPMSPQRPSASRPKWKPRALIAATPWKMPASPHVDQDQKGMIIPFWPSRVAPVHVSSCRLSRGPMNHIRSFDHCRIAGATFETRERKKSLFPALASRRVRLGYDRPMLSKSRINTAICARFAASATSVKSLRKASVEDAFGGAGRGGTILPLAKGEDCCVEDVVDGVWLLADEVNRESIVASVYM